MPEPALKVRVINVGQGACVLFEVPGDPPCFGIIDCCIRERNQDFRPAVLEHLNEEQALRFIVLTHPDTDHILGASQVIESRLGVQAPCALYEGPVTSMEIEGVNRHLGYGDNLAMSEIKSLSDHIMAREVDYHRIEPWEHPEGQLCPGLWYRALAPSKTDWLRYTKKMLRRRRLASPRTEEERDIAKLHERIPKKPSANQISLGLLLVYAPSLIGRTAGVPESGARILIGGDVEEGAWRRPEVAEQLKKVCFVAVPHHGGLGNPPELWSALSASGNRPFVAISCGDFKEQPVSYNHPAQKTLDILIDSNVKINCTNLGRRCSAADIVADVRGQQAGRQLVVNFEEAAAPEAEEATFEDAVAHSADTPIGLSCSDDIHVEIGEDGRVRQISNEIRCFWQR